MWIRSQSGLILVNTKVLYIQEYEGFNDYSIIDPDSDLTLGAYKTRTRALEILDEIEEFLYNKSQETKHSIFKMPEE